MGKGRMAGKSIHLVLVFLTVILFTELTESCHRRVEYHYRLKKPPPPPPHHHHHHHSHHKGHGHGPVKHGPPTKYRGGAIHHPGGHHIGGHEGHGIRGGYHGQGYGGGGGGHRENYDGEGYHPGGGGSYQNVQKGFSRPPPVKGYSHGPPGPGLYPHGAGKGESYPGHVHAHDGPGHSGGSGGYHEGPPSGVAYEGPSGPPGPAYGSPPESPVGFYGGPSPNHGHEDIGHIVYGSPGGSYKPKGHGDDNNREKGHKYKYQMFESMQYDNKGVSHQPVQQQKYNEIKFNEESVPVYMQKGYGHSGPYHDVEYSSPVVVTRVQDASPSFEHQPPRSLNSFNIFDNDRGVLHHPLHAPLDAADTADLIRQGQVRQQDSQFSPSNPSPLPFMHSTLNSEDAARLAELYRGAELISSTDNNENFITASNTPKHPNVVANILMPTATLSMTSGDPPPLPSDSAFHPDAELAGAEIPSTQIDTSIRSDGNFDMNLNYNAELPGPFRRNSVNKNLNNNNNPMKKRRRRRKKISSKYRRMRPNPKKPVIISHHRDFSNNNGEPQPSQTQNYQRRILMNGGPDYLEDGFANFGNHNNDVRSTTGKTYDYTEFMNFYDKKA